MGPATSIHFSRLSMLLTLIFASGILTAPSEIDSELLSKNYVSRVNEVSDSPLERVQVKQETGFDGRVRSIRFGFKPAEQDHRRNEGINKQQFHSSLSNFDFYPIRANYNQNIGLPMAQPIAIEESARELPLFESVSSAVIKGPSRSKRETEKYLPNNGMDDLETAEAKVFRPLFVYRQQVSRRLRLQNNRKSNKNLRQIRSRTRPQFTRYYYPYQYYPSNPYFF